MSTTAATAAPVSSHDPLDANAQQYLDVQQHAAAVQLVSRSLAVAHLRAELAKPRGSALAVKPQPSQLRVKPEPGVEVPSSQQQQHHKAWQGPHQPPKQASAQGAQQPIPISITSTAGDLQLDTSEVVTAAQQQQQQQQHQQQPDKRNQLKPRQLVYRAPDPAAAARFRADEQHAAAEDADSAATSTTTAVAQQPTAFAPRIIADPAVAAQQLAGWVRLGAEGAAVEEGQAGQPADAMDAEQLGPGVEEPMHDEDLMDEEEWI